MKDEGVIKFQCNWTKESHSVQVRKSLLQWRDKMHALGLIGVTLDGIGYGNISLKVPSGMLISGSQTGHLKNLAPDGYALVTGYSIEENSVDCIGTVKASSESLTHLAFYEAEESVKGIIHIHHEGLWKRLLNKVPTSKESVPYGTPQMAQEIKRLFSESTMSEDRIMTMGGHQDGLIAFGSTMEEAGQVILKYIG